MGFSDTKFDTLRSVVREAVLAEVLPRFEGRVSLEVEEKTSPLDVVTQADILAEEHITRELQARFPTALVFGEEAYAKHPGVLDGLVEADLAFVIDPVDGTLNFVKGLPLFGTILSIVQRGECIGGLIHDPIQDTWLMASKGGGAYVMDKMGRETVAKVSAPSDLAQMSGSMCLTFFPEPHKTIIAQRLRQMGAFLGLNCSVFDYWMASTGAVHFTANFCGMYWDHLAGTLIHAEAGGYNARFDGTPYRAFGDGANLLSAPDKESWELIRREILALN